MPEVRAEWAKCAGLPSRLPRDLQQRHTELYGKAVKTARAYGWDPEPGDDE